MKALTRLQSQIMFQSVENESVSQKFSDRAKQMIAFGVFVAAALSVQGAQAQNQVLTPSNCAAVGATVGGLTGAASGKTGVQQAVYAALGALGGGAAGNWLCTPKTRSEDSSYNNAARYGLSDGRSVEVSRQTPKAPLSITEAERLDEMLSSALDAKYRWKKSLYDIDQARQRGDRAGAIAAAEREAQTRVDFENVRDKFSSTVSRLGAGVNGNEPRAVGRYLQVSAALLELNTEARVSYQTLDERDSMLKQRSPTYNEEVERSARMRSSRS